METTEDAPVHNIIDSAKVNALSDETTTLVLDTDICQKSNGVIEAADVPQLLGGSSAEAIEIQSNSTASETTEIAVDADGENVIQVDTVASVQCTMETLSESELPVDLQYVLTEVVEKQPEMSSPNQLDSQPVCPDVNETIAKESDADKNQTESFRNENVTFETEILVETNDNDVNELNLNDTKLNEDVQESTNNILNELDQNLELSEALRSSDNSDRGENNHNVGQEVFNKEELLDILEGNDVQHDDLSYVEVEIPNIKMIEAQLALQQLSRLKRKKRSKVSEIKKQIKSDAEKKLDTNSTAEKKLDTNSTASDSKKDDSIVNVLVKDWEDDEAVEDGHSENLKEKSNNLLNASEELVKAEETVINKEITVERSSVDSAENSVLNKSNEDGQPQRRLGRVIKKKVIFDPDNPDTFTKSKMANKSKDKKEELPTEKDESVSKKGKPDSTSRPKSKSPVSKLQWKKPPPKNNKQNKRLTEVDKLLMDEGAVNMIYQLTPEAPKGKKNMKTKAEFIKKLQSSTPETKEMKFRERKACKGEEGEPKKILGGKQRSSLSSAKSPSACEDFETHSADDSIIYRRHSSSSYSSTCMSPRRLSDVEAGTIQSGQSKAGEGPDLPSANATVDTINDTSEDVFMADISSTEIINKNDCLSIKEKLNSKLSLALNKRKRESSKTEKPVKLKKVAKTEVKPKITEDKKYKHLIITYDQRVAEICIQTTGSTNSEMLKELHNALDYVDSRTDISVTLLTSECGALCPELDLRPLINDDTQTRNNSAYNLAESFRSVVCGIARHSKIVCSGAWGACAGPALALLALSDVALASEHASFSLAATASAQPLQPGLAALSARPQPLPQSLINDLVIFGRKVTASDALRGGLVSRVLWPDGALEQLRAVGRDIAAQPVSNVLLKKRLLHLNNMSNNTFLSCFEKERDLFVEYWTSVEGQELLRANLSVK